MLVGTKQTYCTFSTTPDVTRHTGFRGLCQEFYLDLLRFWGFVGEIKFTKVIRSGRKSTVVARVFRLYKARNVGISYLNSFTMSRVQMAVPP